MTPDATVNSAAKTPRPRTTWCGRTRRDGRVSGVVPDPDEAAGSAGGETTVVLMAGAKLALLGPGPERS
jgi:hypothetical protein